MSLKSKKMRKIARNAAMSALIVSAIVGTGVVASAATDNLSITSTPGLAMVSTDGKAGIVSGTVDVTTATNATIGGLKVSGGTLYVGKNFTVTGKLMGAEGTNTNAWVTGGSVVVGQNAPGGANVNSGTVTMTVDNMTIAGGGLVSVTNSSTLKSTGDVDINSGGTLKMSGHFSAPNTPLDASGSTLEAANVNINGGTLEASQGLQNLIKATGAVNLKGGVINVATGGKAALTIGNGSDSAVIGLAAGDLAVTTNGKLNSYGGTIKANLKSSGTTGFKSGTTTVDNMTVAAGTTTISGNATVNVLGDKPEVAGGTLEMQGGTLRVAGGQGTLVISSGTLHSSANVNTIDASVKQTGGLTKVDGGSTLNITKNLDVTGGTVTVKGGATLNVAGTTKLATAGAVTVGDTTASTGFFSITKDSILVAGANGTFTANSGIANNAIKLNTVAPTTVDGVLIITGWNGTVDATKVAAGLTGVDGDILNNSLTGNNVILMGAALDGVAAKIDNGALAAGGIVAYGAAVTVNVAPGSGTFTNEGTIIVPKLVAGAGADTFVTDAAGKTTLVGTGAADSTTSFNKFENAGATTLMGGATLVAGEVLSTGTGVMSVESGSTLKAGTLDMTAGTVDVLNATANIGTLKATAGTIFVDPAIVNIGSIQDNDLKNVSLLTGAGSVVTLGGTQGWMNKPMADAGFAFGNGAQSTLGLAPTDTITIGATGVVAVDPTIVKNGANYEFTKTDGTTGTADRATMGAFYAGNNTLTVLDLSALGSNPVFDLDNAADQKVNIVNGAKLHVANLTVNGVQIFDNSGTGGVIVGDGSAAGIYNPDAVNAGWAGSNLIQPDRMLSAKMTSTGYLDADVNSASFALGMSSEFEGLMQGVWGTAMNNTNSPNAGIRLVSRAASTDFGLSANQAAKTIEGAAQLAAVAGVQGVTIGAANAATSAVATRTSFAQPLLDKTKAVAMNMDSEGHVTVDSGLNAGNGMKNGVALWIMPLFQSNNVWGQKAGNFKSGYNSDLGGVAAGVDYTVNDMFRFGAALNIGAGYGQSSGDFNSTDNSFNFWGVNLYGGWTMNNLGITADVGYTGNYNKVEQDAPASLGMSNFKSDINSSAWTAGLKAEYKIETEMLDIIPHIGVRYMGLNTEQYDVKGGGGTVFDVEQNFQSIWTFPIGVALSKNIETGSGWVFKPQLDLSVIPAAGDVEAKSKSRIPGAIGSADAKMQVVDYVTFDGGAGFEIGNDNLSFGLNYNIQASEHRTGHGVFGTVRYEF